MSGPKAYFLTWTTYGAWVHGDARGTVDDEHNRYMTPRAPACEARARANRAAMNSVEVRLGDDHRKLVDEAIRDHCAFRSWWLGALSVRSNHVHCVVHSGETAPEQVVGQLKSWATRRLRERGAFAPTHRIWAREASTRYLWKEHDVRAAQQYVLECQDLPHKQSARRATGA
jgi:REP element-mobilizing transposase RayT